MKIRLYTAATKFITVKDMDDVNISFLKRHAEKYKRSFAKKIRPNKVSMDVNKWVVQANPDGTITLLAPLL